MIVGISIFQEFNLPNSTTWFYFSLLLAIALFFRFTRLLSVRNIDVIALFLLVPGLLLLLEAQARAHVAQGKLPFKVGALLMESAAARISPHAGFDAAALVGSVVGDSTDTSSTLAWFGYLWLLCGSALFFMRCLLDLVLIGRPALAPNLNPSGLIWLSLALFVCLVVVAFQKPAGPPGPVGKQSVAVNETQRRADYLVKQQSLLTELMPDNSALLVECGSAVICHFFIVCGLAFIGWKHFQDLQGGVAAAAFYLLLPYTAYHVDQVHHVLPTAFLVWAVASYRKPLLAGLLLGLAAGIGYSALFLVFPWLGFYWKRGHARFLLGFFFAVSLIAGLIWAEGNLTVNIQTSLSLSDWQPWQQPHAESTKGFWTGVAWAPAYRLPVFVAYVGFVLATTFWPAPKNLAHLIALSAAILIGIQFWFADQGGVYVLWYLPFLLLMVFRPNCTDRVAPLPTIHSDWLRRWLRLLGGAALRLWRSPEPTSQLH